MPKGGGPSKKHFERKYETSFDDDYEWVKKEMKDQIWSTVSSIKEQKLRDSETAYIVLGVESQYIPNEDVSKIRKKIFYPNTKTVIENLSGEVLSYLNKEHTNLLVSCPLSKLLRFRTRSKYRMKYFNGVKRISPLLPDEQISVRLKNDKDWRNNSKEVIVEIIPNIALEKKQEYSNKIIEYLSALGMSANSICNKDFIVSDLDEISAKKLLKSCNLIFRISENPKGVLKQQNGSLMGREKNKLTKKPLPSFEVQKKYNNLPVICVLDTGVCKLPQFDGLLVKPLDGYRRISLFDDDYGKHGHGTPVAYLAIFGEDETVPKAKVVSYKIFSEYSETVYFEGYGLAFAKYSSEYNPNKSRIFVSSIGFDDYDDVVTAYVDKSIQENNICAVFAAGNIDEELVSNYASNGIPCSSYIGKYPVQDPSQAINALAIGAIAKKDSQTSISRINEPSPFTRCGIINGGLYDCQKPEFVDNGGNQCVDGTPLGITSLDKKGKFFSDFLGTSFSAPLFANRLAEIVSKYGENFKNAETLKAIAFALSSGQLTDWKGFGEVLTPNQFDYDNRALVCSEGTIPLIDTLSEKHWNIRYSGEITVQIPNFVNSIKLFLVHSDDHFLEASPQLNTYLQVRATKIPYDSPGPLKMINTEENNRKTNMKVFEWAYPTRSMGGLWTFSIRPKLTADLSAKHKKETTIRYGCAILLNSKTPTRSKSLSEEVYNLNKHLFL